MSKNYKYARPVTIDGLEYRGSTEATWHIASKIAGLNWIYEPFELDSYIPDFVAGDLLIEVKGSPEDYLNWQVYAKRARQAGWPANIVIVGPDPQFIAPLDKLILPEDFELAWNQAKTITKWRPKVPESIIHEPRIPVLPAMYTRTSLQAVAESLTQPALPPTSKRLKKTVEPVMVPTPKLPLF